MVALSSIHQAGQSRLALKYSFIGWTGTLEKEKASIYSLTLFPSSPSLPFPSLPHLAHHSLTHPSNQRTHRKRSRTLPKTLLP